MPDHCGLIKEMEQDRAAKRASDETVADVENLHGDMPQELRDEIMVDLPHNRLVAFLYLMMRDEVPTGVICKKITDLTEKAPTGFQFSNPHLEALARDYANRIREG